MKIIKIAAISASMLLTQVVVGEEAASNAGGVADTNGAAAPKSSSAEAGNGTFASEYSCAMNSAKRMVRVSYDKETGKAPCKVIYVRDAASAEEKVLYSATIEQGYCEKKAGDFVEKLKGSGWSCSSPQ